MVEHRKLADHPRAHFRDRVRFGVASRGYPASSLKERIYAVRSLSGAYDRCGILIYTASTGAQGTLGGLVGIAPRFAEILESALRRVEICSNDPVCSDHAPDGRSGDRATRRAACHGCLLIAETSCESRNQFLDRAVLVATMRSKDTAFVAAIQCAGSLRDPRECLAAIGRFGPLLRR